jgi:hypothetical protein
MIKGKIKFSAESYAENNTWGIQKTTRILQAGGYEVYVPQGEEYTIDLTAQKGGQTYRFEAEVKKGYPFTTQYDYSFPTVSFLARKSKWNDEVGFWYVVLCRETEAYFVCHSSEVYQEEYKECMEIDVTHYKGHDCFYRVPLDKCLWNQLPI